MTIPLKYNTASQEVPLGIFVDPADGHTEEASLSIANTDIKLWKNGATSLVSKNSGGATYMSNGIYYCVLDATDTNTVGPLVIYVHITGTSGALAVKLECVVYPAEVYDTLFAGTDNLTVDISTAGAAAVADKLLGRNLAGGSDGGRVVRDALRFLRNKWTISGTTLSVKQEDDSTEAWSATVTVDAGANPITGNDPS